MGGEKEIYRDVRFFHRALQLFSPACKQEKILTIECAIDQ